MVPTARQITPAQIKAVSKYEKENYDKVLVRMPKGKRESVKDHAEAQGESINGFINRAIDEQMERDNCHSTKEVPVCQDASRVD